MSHRALAVAAVALVVISASVLVAQWVQWASVPKDADWEQVAKAAQEDWSEGAAFMVEPNWESRPRVFMGRSAYIPADAPTLSDVAPYDRIALLSEAGREEDGRARVPAGWKGGAVLVHGTASLRWFEAPDARPWDAVSALRSAKVTRHYPGRKVQCDKWQASPPAWHCGKRDKWLYVGETMQPVTNDTHRCLWAMPIDRGGRLHVTFPDVPAGALRGNLGQTLPAVRSKRGTPVSFEVRQGTKSLYRKTLGIHEEGFLEWDAGTVTAGPVEFVVQAESQVDRFFCFTATSQSGE